MYGEILDRSQKLRLADVIFKTCGTVSKQGRLRGKPVVHSTFHPGSSIQKVNLPEGLRVRDISHISPRGGEFFVPRSNFAYDHCPHA